MREHRKLFQIKTNTRTIFCKVAQKKHFVIKTKFAKGRVKEKRKLVVFSTKNLTPSPFPSRKKNVSDMEQILYDMGPLTLV